MDMIMREYTRGDAEEAAVTWNRVAEEGIAFPQTDYLIRGSADAFFPRQSLTGTTFGRHSGAMMDLYTLYPNNVGRCGHIRNASCVVKWDMRGRQIREKLVHHCMEKGRRLDFSILQFNAVVKTNEAILHPYQKLGFAWLGVIPGSFLIKDGRYEDTTPHYIVL